MNCLKFGILPHFWGKAANSKTGCFLTKDLIPKDIYIHSCAFNLHPVQPVRWEIPNLGADILNDVVS